MSTYFDIFSQFILEVEASYLEYVQIRNNPIAGNAIDLRNALEACRASYHFGEYLAIHLGRQFNNDLLNDIKKDYPDYDLLRNVVNASKHGIHNQGRNILITNADQILEVTYLIEFEDELGIYRHAEKGILLTLDDGSKRELLDVMTNVTNMWFELLNEFGITDKKKKYLYNDSVIYSRIHDDAIARNSEFLIRGDLGFTSSVCFKKHNYKSGKREDIPLSFHLPIVLKNASGNKQVDFNLELTSEENDSYNLITDETQKQLFISEVIERKNIYTKLTKEQSEILWSEETKAKFVLCITHNNVTICRDLEFTEAETLKYRALENPEDQKAFQELLADQKGVNKALYEEARRTWPDDFN